MTEESASMDRAEARGLAELALGLQWGKEGAVFSSGPSRGPLAER